MTIEGLRLREIPEGELGKKPDIFGVIRLGDGTISQATIAEASEYWKNVRKEWLGSSMEAGLDGLS